METEAVTPAASRFYCHSCSTEIDHVLGGFKCPHCLDGFIEELPPESAAPTQEDGATGDYGNVENQALRFANELINNPLLTPILMSTSGARPGDAYGEGSSDDSLIGGRVSRRAGGFRRDFNITNFDTILQDILISVGGGGGVGAGEGAPMFFMGNPGDYAWGREGLDTIVTQLLNQMDNTGPPPLEKEKIDELPQVKIEEEQVAAKLQCSVCWEDFQLEEPVKKLPCGHVYHDNCIVPWLQYHGTCPICRQSLVNEQSNDHQQHQRSSLSAAAQVVANTIRNVTSAMRPTGGSSSSASNSQDDATGSSSASSSVGAATHINSSEFSPSSFLCPNSPPFPQIHPYTRPHQQQQQGTPMSSSTNSSSSTSAPSASASTSTPGSNTRPNDDRMRDDDGNIDYDFD